MRELYTPDGLWLHRQIYFFVALFILFILLFSLYNICTKLLLTFPDLFVVKSCYIADIIRGVDRPEETGCIHAC